ncbi:DegT/DnrJ/EryC1/StrS family aminotransferase [Patescibacteria group bacterium]|nr:DegT/DnrJ/EryC1/StrS family aminotransferase [Patescibacteria group bacterium]
MTLKNQFDIPLYRLNSNYSSKVYNCGKWVDGIKIKELEEKIKDFLDIKYIVLTNSGTSALLAAYWVLKDEYKTLNVDPYTFPATYQPAKLLSYEINFVRTILKNNVNLPKNELNVITHLFGQPNQLLAKTRRIPFIEDACQSFGAKYKGKNVGTFGKLGCLSFYPTKPLHTNGHGGAVVTNNKDHFEKLKIFIESGRLNGKMTERIALNLRMDEIKAEFLLYELKNYEKRIACQRQIAQGFKNLITGEQPFLKEDKDSYHVYSVFNILVENRKEFRKYMGKKGIETMIYYNEDILPVGEKPKYLDLTASIVAIPCRWNLTNQEISKIKNALKGWFV